MEPSVAELTMPIESTAGSSVYMSNASQTEIQVEYIKHNWTVKNFSHCYQEYLENYVNLPRGDDVLTWSIKIYPKGNGENNKDFVFLCLNRVIGNNVKNNKIGFRSRFFLKNSEGKDIEMRIHPNPSHSDYVSYIKRDVLFPQISPTDSITVFVEIDVAVETITTTVDDHIANANTEKHLADDYSKLLSENILTDFTIKVGEKEIRAHKAILAARSPVFAAMLDHEDTTESKTGTLVIKDVDFAVVKEMLNFIYCGRNSSDINELASDLLIAADKYRLDELKNNCERCLFQAINFENACQLLIIGDMYHAETLRQKAVKFILQHPKVITGTPGWDTVLSSHPQLVTDIVRSFDKFYGQSSSISGLCDQSLQHPQLTPSSSTSNAQTHPSTSSSGSSQSSANLYSSTGVTVNAIGSGTSTNVEHQLNTFRNNPTMTGGAMQSIDGYDNYWGGNTGELNSPDMMWQGSANSYGAVQSTNNAYPQQPVSGYNLPQTAVSSSPYAGYLEKQIASYPIMIYTLNDCIPCQRAKQFLALNYPNVRAHFLELSGNEPWQLQLQNDLQYLTGVITFPYIFVCGQYIGGQSDLFELHESGQLQQMVAQCLKTAVPK